MQLEPLPGLQCSGWKQHYKSKVVMTLFSHILGHQFVCWEKLFDDELILWLPRKKKKSRNLPFSLNSSFRSNVWFPWGRIASASVLPHWPWIKARNVNVRPPPVCTDIDKLFVQFDPTKSWEFTLWTVDCQNSESLHAKFSRPSNVAPNPQRSFVWPGCLTVRKLSLFRWRKCFWEDVEGATDLLPLLHSKGTSATCQESDRNLIPPLLW